jgi:hypothetical protein
MTRKSERKPDDPEQSKRFIETAIEVGAGSEDVLEQALDKIHRRKSAADQSSKKPSK